MLPNAGNASELHAPVCKRGWLNGWESQGLRQEAGVVKRAEAKQLRQEAGVVKRVEAKGMRQEAGVEGKEEKEN